MTQLIIVDCEGVLIDYNKHFKIIYEKILNKRLDTINDQSFHLHNYYNLEWENNETKKKFFLKFNDLAWETATPLDNSVEATKILKQKGYKIIVLSSVPEKYQEKIHNSLIKCGFYIDATIAVGRLDSIKSKKNYVEILQPRYFVDDLKASFYGLSSKIRNILIDKDFHDSPNKLYEQNVNIHSTNSTLYDFVKIKLS